MKNIRCWHRQSTAPTPQPTPPTADVSATTKERGNPTSSLALISHGIFFIGTEISRTGSWMMQSESPIDSPMASRNTKSECLLLAKAPLVTLNEHSGLRGQSPADGQGLSRNTETHPPYFSSGGMKTICHLSEHLTIPLQSILWARPRGELPTWRSRQAGRPVPLAETDIPGCSLVLLLSLPQEGSSEPGAIGALAPSMFWGFVTTPSAPYGTQMALMPKV